MRIIADLHIHSKYSRATSKNLDLPTIGAWARRKGINVVGTGDFTHPAHFADIEELLVPAGRGLFRLKTDKDDDSSPMFMLTAEISNIFRQGRQESQGGQEKKTRKVHSVVFAPSLKAVREINKTLSKLGNLSSDGRPTFGFSAAELLKIVLHASPDCMVVPAHAWTPWFSVFGSKSGFDSLEECYGDLTKHIHAIETGLSSNPEMNRLVSGLDGITLISNSDAHSPQKLGREVNVLECDQDYFDITGAFKKGDRKKFLYTVEFHPEEGKYHYDGHRACGVLMSPKETARSGGRCPVCTRPVTVGVMNRIDVLADRRTGAGDKKTKGNKNTHILAPPGSISLVPLQEIIAEAMGRGVNTKGVQNEYTAITDKATEFAVLIDLDEDALRNITTERIATGIMKVRRGELSITPGFDGEFGKVKIFEETEAPMPTGPTQMGLL